MIIDSSTSISISFSLDSEVASAIDGLNGSSRTRSHSISRAMKTSFVALKPSRCHQVFLDGFVSCLLSRNTIPPLPLYIVREMTFRQTLLTC